MWRTSSHSADNGSCVAVRFPPAGPVAVRDSKHPAGPRLAFPEHAWASFLRHQRCPLR
ncbi:DUF397 domain-containing protein [Saccharothrix australiensis]|uniref:DUF397 domain-containing protein n=1 Tax=Saccharothrix australiensis TaxID=2072 RepID=UPI000EAF345E|nr:DUF397 domain-containing protein [Saccharothrix australiensis]